MSKRFLPVISENRPATSRPDEPLHLERARKQLGGEALSNAGAGRVVRVQGAGHAPTLGVVLHQTERDVDVWVTPTQVRRTRHEQVTAVDSNASEVSEELLRAASDARVFGAIERGARVRYDAGEGRVAEGAVIERCRYGALVARDDGAVMAIGFRRLWPVGSES